MIKKIWWVIVTVLMYTIIFAGCGNDQKSKFNEKKYNEILDAYIQYGEDMSSKYSDITMTLSLDGDNKPIFLAFMGKREEAMLEISSYIDGSVKTLDTIKANHVWKLDNGIIVAQYFDESEENMKYRIVQVKDDELRLLMKGKGEWGKTCYDSEINLYFGDENKKTTIQGTYASDDWYYYPVAKDYEDEIREWFTYVYGNDERYLDWMSNFAVDVIFCEGDTIIDDIPLMCSSYTLFEANGVWEVDSYESIITLRSMINKLKNEPCTNWKDFFIYDTNRLYELFGYKLGYANTVFPHIDASWISELDYIKDLKVLTTEESWGEERIDYGYILCNAGILDGSVLYGFLYGMNPIISNDSECSKFEDEFIIRPIKSDIQIMDDNSEYSSHEIYSMYLEVNEELLNQWLTEYLGIENIEDAVDLKIDNSALIKNYYQWILSDEYAEKFDVEQKKHIQEEKEKEEKKKNFGKVSEIYNTYMTEKGYDISDYKYFADDINNDGIPELVCLNYDGFRGMFLTIIDNKVQEYGKECGWNNIYCIKDEKIKMSGYGIADGHVESVIIVNSQDGNVVVDVFDYYRNFYTDEEWYELNRQKISRSEYYRGIETSFDESEAETIQWKYSIYDAMMSLISEVIY